MIVTTIIMAFPIYSNVLCYSMYIDNMNNFNGKTFQFSQKENYFWRKTWLSLNIRGIAQNYYVAIAYTILQNKVQDTTVQHHIIKLKLQNAHFLRFRRVSIQKPRDLFNNYWLLTQQTNTIINK
jgi:hypothetical protein